MIQENKEERNVSNRITFGLYGINGLYNYGCEAIVRGVTFLLREAIPNCSIVYFSPRKEEDEIKITDLGIEVKLIKRRKLTLTERVINKILTKLSIEKRISNEDYKQVINSCDVMVSIGGDLYTIPENERNKTKYSYIRDIVEIGNRIKKRGKKLLIFGCSIGPFGTYQKAVTYFTKGLRHSDLIIAREQKCLDYLENLGIFDNTCLMPDPAFYVKDGTPTSQLSERKYIGINLSPLSLVELYGTVSNDTLKKQAELVESIMDKTQLPVLFIPHVISYNESDNDYLHMKKLMTFMDKEHVAKITLTHPNSFLDAKKILRECRMLVAARMHCAVNALSETVPTILLSYSTKSVGMAEIVYGNDEWVVSLKEDSSVILNSIRNMNENYVEVSKYLSERMKVMRKIDNNDLSKNTIRRLREIIIEQ